MTTQRMTPAERKQQILDLCLDLAQEHGYMKVTYDHIADVVGISRPAIVYHFSCVEELHEQIIKHAVRQECLPVIAQGLAQNDPTMGLVSKKIRKEALKSLS